MSLFDKLRGNKSSNRSTSTPLPGRSARCRICNKESHFSKCWRRDAPISQCTGCGTKFDQPNDYYRTHQPACPHCGEFLEQPGFEYGICDECGSKFELVTGTVPALLPNSEQRAQMNPYGDTKELS